MNNVEFNQTGGFPLTTNILNALQEAYKIFQAFGYMAGNLSIISGCEKIGSRISDGVIFINGELLPFKGGQEVSEIRVRELVNKKSFENGENKGVHYVRYAEFGSDLVSYNWSDFKRFSPLTSISNRLEQLETRVSKIVPIDLIAIWDRPADQIPEGWVEHIPMAGFTPVGLKKHDVDFGLLGKTLGAKKHKLTIPETPSHSHDYVASSSAWAVEPRGGNQHLRALPPGGKKTSSIGGDQPHNNIQPSRIVHFIKFIGFNN